MAIYTDDKYRLRRNTEHQEMMLKLIQAGVFSQYADILMISAILGYLNKQFIPIEKTAQDRVQITFFSEQDKDFIDFVAFAHEKKQIILNTNDDTQKYNKYMIFENYANGGFPILINKLEISNDDEEIDLKSTLLKYYHILMTSNYDIDFEMDSLFYDN